MNDIPDPLISISAAAREIGVDQSTLSKQVRQGLVRSHDGKVRLSEVLADRAANIDLGRSKRRDGAIDRPDANAKASVRSAPAADSEDDADADDAVVMVDGVPVSYAEARALKETYLAKLKRLEFETKQGELAPVAETHAFAERMISITRSRLLTLPGKWSGLVDCEQLGTITDDLYEAMEELSDPRSVLDDVDALSLPDCDGDESDEAPAAAEPRRVGRALPLRRAKDIRRPRPLEDE